MRLLYAALLLQRVLLYSLDCCLLQLPAVEIVRLMHSTEFASSYSWCCTHTSRTSHFKLLLMGPAADDDDIRGPTLLLLLSCTETTSHLGHDLKKPLLAIKDVLLCVWQAAQVDLHNALEQARVDGYRTLVDRNLVLWITAAVNRLQRGTALSFRSI